MSSETRSKHSRPSVNATMKGIPAFLRSLYNIVNNDNYDMIYWSEEGDSFLIEEHDRFAKEVLGRWFKHTNYSSFVRQLNNYGFHKILQLQQGALHSDSSREKHHYSHPDFRRDRLDFLARIQRKGQSAPEEPIKSPDIHNPTPVKEELVMTEVAPSEDFSQSRLVEAILLEVESLKHRQDEQERENRILHDKVAVLETNVARHQDIILRLLASMGLIPIVDYNWATRGHGQLMIQGVIENDVPGKTKIGEAAGLDGQHAISSPFSSPSISAIGGGGDHTDSSQQNSPISTDEPASPPPPSPSSSVVDLTQSTGHLGLTTGALNCGDSEISTQAQDYLTGYPFVPLQSDLLCSDSFPFSLDNSKSLESIDLSGESIIDYDRNYDMDEIYPGIFHDFSSSHTSGSSGDGSAISDPSLKLEATSSMQITTDDPPASLAQGDSTHTTASAKGIKRKVDLVHEPRIACAHAPVPTLSLHGAQHPANFQPPALLSLKDQHITESITSTQLHAPNGNFTFNISTTISPSGGESENRSPKRAKLSSRRKGDKL